MDEKEAIEIARAWTFVRKDVRKHLIEAARRCHPGQEYGEWPSSDVRKLHQFPSDLSEARLLDLIEGR